MPTVNIIGVGYIGTVISCYLTEKEYQINGIDKNPDVLNKDSWFRRFSDIESNLKKANLDLVTTSTSYKDIDGDSVSIICVDTPTNENGELYLSNLKDSIESLSKEVNNGHTIIVRSTILPGTSEEVIIPLIEERSGMKVGEDIYYGYAPEFVRGGSGIEDIKNPSKQVIAGDKEAAETFQNLFPYEETFETDLRTAEGLKYFDNVFTGLKVSLANEVGRAGESLNFDAKKVMEILVSDTKLNISEEYLKPGNSFGGPCLKKDISALNNKISSKAELPIVSSIIESNKTHTSWIISQITSKKDVEVVGLVGATYKEDFNSLEQSPYLKVKKELEEKGYQTETYSPILKDSIDSIPREELLETDLIVVFNSVSGLEEIKEEFDGSIIDLSNFDI